MNAIQTIESDPIENVIDGNAEQAATPNNDLPASSNHTFSLTKVLVIVWFICLSGYLIYNMTSSHMCNASGVPFQRVGQSLAS